jgi:hypothetical protein
VCYSFRCSIVVAIERLTTKDGFGTRYVYMVIMHLESYCMCDATACETGVLSLGLHWRLVGITWGINAPIGTASKIRHRHFSWLLIASVNYCNCCLVELELHSKMADSERGACVTMLKIEMTRWRKIDTKSIQRDFPESEISEPEYASIEQWKSVYYVKTVNKPMEFQRQWPAKGRPRQPCKRKVTRERKGSVDNSV